MKAGFEDKKKLVLLGLLSLGVLYGMYSAFSGPSVPASTPAAPAAARDRASADLPAIPTASEASAPRASSRSSAIRSQEFHPVLRSKRPEDRIAPETIDPTLKLDLLARLQQVAPAGGGRNLFQFGAPPPKELPKGPETTVKVAKQLYPPLFSLADLEPKKPQPPPTPPPTPFTAKYYGLAANAANGRKRAFFLDGDEIVIRGEGETVKGHFRVVKIGVTSVVVEDTTTKRQQTVQIAEDAQA